MDIISRESLSKILSVNYGIKPKIVDKSAWGYSSITYYVEDEAGKKYAAKTTIYSDEKKEKLDRDISLSLQLNNFVKTPHYIRDTEGKYLIKDENILVRVSDYIEGTSPFDMNMDIYVQIVELLKDIHRFPVADLSIKLPEYEPKTENAKLLHGDLTPSNIIVAFDVIVGVLDFEDSFIGPVEYDLSRSAVFSWFRMKDIPFQEVFDVTHEKYSGADRKLTFDFAMKHSKNHLDQVVQNKNKYSDMVFWNDDYLFSSRAYETISKTLI
jgi:thiamine kinase-like enzyme